MKKDTHNSDLTNQSNEDQQQDVMDVLLAHHSYIIVQIS